MKGRSERYIRFSMFQTAEAAGHTEDRTLTEVYVRTT